MPGPSNANFPQATLIFILPPSLTELERRLQGRGGLDPEELARRLENGRAELKEAHWYDYLVINDDKATALSHLQAIVAAARCRTSQLWPAIGPPLSQPQSLISPKLLFPDRYPLLILFFGDTRYRIKGSEFEPNDFSYIIILQTYRL